MKRIFLTVRAHTVLKTSCTPRLVMGVLVPYTHPGGAVRLRLMLPEFVQLMAKAIDADTSLKPLPGLDEIGQTRSGTTAISRSFNLSLRWDIVAFRRNDVGVILYLFYPDGDKPVIPIADLARLQDGRIQGHHTASVTPGPKVETIKVGLLNPLTGPVPTFGKSVLEGVQLAVDEWNAKGGLLGKPIELVVADSQCSSDYAPKAANHLIDEYGVKYIIGEVCSKASIPVSEIVNQKKVLQISPTSTDPLVTVDNHGNTKPFSFRACFVDSFQGQVMAKFAKEKGYKTAFIVYDLGSDYSVSLAKAFEGTFTEMGGQILGKSSTLPPPLNFPRSWKRWPIRTLTCFFAILL